MAYKALRFASLVLLASLLLACGDDSPGGVSTGASPFSGDACVASEEPCDIANAECQQEILALTACVRGERAPALPVIRTLTQAEFREELLAEAGALSRTESPWDTAFSLFGWLAPGTRSIDASIEETVTSVAAYYNDQDQRVTVIAQTMPQDERTRMFVLSHELTHYLQDQAQDLAALHDAWVVDFDSRVSLGALVEGDAVASSTRVSARWRGVSAGEVLWTDYFDQMQQAMFEQIAASPTPLYTAQQTLPYPVGGRYVTKVWNEHGRARVDALYEGASTRLSDWLRDPDGELGATVSEPLDCAPALPPDGLVVYGLDGLGPTGVLALLAADGGGITDDDLRLAEALRADAFAVYAESSDLDTAPITPVAVAWRLRFARASDAESLLLTGAAARLGLAATRAGVEVLFTAASPDGPSFPAAAATACPTFDALVPPGSREAMSAAPRLPRPHLHSRQR